MIGKSVAHYEIQEKIGQGGMGAVYRATDKKFGRLEVGFERMPSGVSLAWPDGYGVAPDAQSF